MHLTAGEIGGDEGVKLVSKSWSSFAQNYVKKRLGKTDPTQGKAAAKTGLAKQRRTKAYQNIMQIHNMMVGVGKQLPNLIIKKLPDGTWPDPFLWEGANCLTDRAADIVSTDAFLR